MDTSNIRRAPLRQQLVVLAFSFVVVLPSVSYAYFDIVDLYQEKIKAFEAVDYLERDREWLRDRRLFEYFVSGDRILAGSSDDGDDSDGYTNLSGGLLLNVRPGKKGTVQVSLFNLWSGNQMGVDDMQVWEALHGGRITFGDVFEFSLGSYWSSGSAGYSPYGNEWQVENRRGASAFMEVNSPYLFLKSSYVLGIHTNDTLERWDLRFDYDILPWADSLIAGVVQYGFSDQTMFKADILRLGSRKFRFLSAEALASTGGLAWARAGFDMMFQSGEDFNLTRRGHFATSLGLQAFYSYLTSEGAEILGKPGSGAQHGAKFKLSAQVPAKWVMLVLSTFAAAASGNPQDRDAALWYASEVAREPRDMLFCRVEFEYTYNAPETYGLNVPSIVDRHRLFLSLGFVY